VSLDVDLPQPFLPAPGELEEVRRLRREGLLQQVLGAVHLPAGVPVTAEHRARAVALLLPEPLQAGGAVLGFTAAAWVHTGWTPAGGRPELLDLVLPPFVRQRADDPGVRVRQMRLPAGHVGRLAGLPLTTPARTVADLARALPAARARAAFDALRRAAPLDVVDVLRCLDQMPRARGCSQARLVVAAWPEAGPGLWPFSPPCGAR
jgi:hypothetical protein